jgi:hypothetical protein
MMSDKGYSIGNEADQRAFAEARNYPPMSKVQKLAEQVYGSAATTQELKFAQLFLLQSIEVMKQHDYHGEWLGDKLKEYWGIDNEMY